jgi:hypothetical protein
LDLDFGIVGNWQAIGLAIPEIEKNQKLMET